MTRVPGWLGGLGSSTYNYLSSMYCIGGVPVPTVFPTKARGPRDKIACWLPLPDYNLRIHYCRLGT